MKGTVVKVMEQISSIAARTQRGAESTVATVAELAALSAELKAGMSKFKVS